MKLFSRQIYGYTMLELVTVIAIVAILGGLAYPRYVIMLERQKATEGVNTLIAIYGAQWRHHDRYGDFAWQSEWDELDITLPPLKYFAVVALFGGGLLALAERQERGAQYYALGIMSTGTITCYPMGGNPYGPNICSKLGF